MLTDDQSILSGEDVDGEELLELDLDLDMDDDE
jgi:hypothetical protein